MHSFNLRLLVLLISMTGTVIAAPAVPNARPPKSDEDLRAWLENMVWYHGFSTAEIQAATGLSKVEIAAALEKFDIRPDNRPQRKKGEPLLVLPYPGGRHPRIGFLDGAVRPQRETKVSVFTPWNPEHYVVADVPEAIWSNLGLTYLAHTHVETIWTKQGVELEKTEWTKNKDGSYGMARKLPNGIALGSKVIPGTDGVRMRMWLTNGTEETLTGMRVQNCVMLKGAPGFQRQTNENKVNRSPFAACRSKDGARWIITAWQPTHRVWANERCPCLHSDPRFPDCPPGETRRLRGWLSFYEGKDIQAEFDRLEKLDWWKDEE